MGGYVVKNGGGSGILVEPLVVIRNYPAQWIRPKLEWAELANLRSKGWSISKIVAHTGIPRTTVFTELKKLKEGWAK